MYHLSIQYKTTNEYWFPVREVVNSLDDIVELGKKYNCPTEICVNIKVFLIYFGERKTDENTLIGC